MFPTKVTSFMHVPFLAVHHHCDAVRVTERTCRTAALLATGRLTRSTAAELPDTLYSMEANRKNATADLVEALTAETPQLQAAVSDALGTTGAPTGDRVLGHVLQNGDSSLCYMITRTSLHRVEVAADDRQLLVTIPLRRIRQIIERSDANTRTLVVEVDADVTSETTVSQSITEATPEGSQATRSEARSVTTPTSYTITGPRDDRQLAVFAGAVRTAFDEQG